MAKTPEGTVVEYGRKRLVEKGCLVRKISYEGRRGCPDMLVLVPHHEVWHGSTRMASYQPYTLFIEYKKDENTEPEPHQIREHSRMRDVGADVRVIGSKAEVDALIGELFPS